MEKSSEHGKCGYVVITPFNDVAFIESTTEDVEGIKQEVAGLACLADFDVDKLSYVRCDNSLFHRAGIGESIGIERGMDFVIVFPNEGLPNSLATLISDKSHAPTSREGYTGVIGPAVMLWATNVNNGKDFMVSPFDEDIAYSVIDCIVERAVVQLNKNLRKLCRKFVDEEYSRLPELCKVLGFMVNDYEDWQSGKSALDLDTMHALYDYMVGAGSDFDSWI